MSEETKQEAVRRIERAMQLIEHAQGTIGEAAGQITWICGPGMADEYFRLHKLFDAVKSHWYRLQNKLTCGRFDLDSTAAARFIESKQKVQVS